MARTFFCALLSWMVCLPALGLEVTDNTGRQVKLDHSAQRILALSPHTTELVFAAGAGSKLVGVVSHSDYPPEAKNIARVGDAHLLDKERIVALQPDLVIGWESGNRGLDLEWLERRGINVYRSEPRHLSQIADNIRHIGLLTGFKAESEQAATRFEQRLDQLQQRYQRTKPVSVFYQLWPQPLTTVNGDHIISQLLTLCGGRNIFADLTTLAPQINREAVILADPQAIVAGINRPEELAQWKQTPGLQAVKRGHLIPVKADFIHRASPRILDGAEQICAGLNKVN